MVFRVRSGNLLRGHKVVCWNSLKIKHFSMEKFGYML